MSTWVYTITNRTVLDYYRTRKVHGQIPEEDGATGAMPENLVDSAPLDSDLMAKEQLAELADALERIPERSRDILILHYYQNMTLKEVALRIGMSYANIKLVHKKALVELRQLMAS